MFDIICIYLFYYNFITVTLETQNIVQQYTEYTSHSIKMSEYARLIRN